VGWRAEAAASGRITKVLPHLLDPQGRHTLSPSLYERDAYQAFLRANPDRCSGLRFNVQWKTREIAVSGLKLRIELRGSKEARTIVLEQPVKRRHRSSAWPRSTSTT